MKIVYSARCKWSGEIRNYYAWEWWILHKNFNSLYAYCFRDPRTTQERRRYIADLDVIKEYGMKIKFRNGRSNRQLPSAYDDIIIKCYVNKGWKKLRRNRKQWMHNL